LGAAARLRWAPASGPATARTLDPAEGHDPAAALAAALATTAAPVADVAAVGHRIVHGGLAFAKPALIDDAVYAALDALAPLAPLHQPHNLAGVRAGRAMFPAAAQVACFDTAFHRGHAFAEDAYALPRALYDDGVRRYGFHGLSHEYVSGRVREIAPDIAGGRVVIAHVGNGASMCGLREGRSVTSTMGFSTLDGLPMGTRTGQIDPGVLLYLLTAKGYDAARLTDLLYHRSGLLGLSGVSYDWREIETAGTSAAEDAVAYFVHRMVYELGGLAATSAASTRSFSLAESANIRCVCAAKSPAPWAGWAFCWTRRPIARRRRSLPLQVRECASL
jgi:acetate kinase